MSRMLYSEVINMPQDRINVINYMKLTYFVRQRIFWKTSPPFVLVVCASSKSPEPIVDEIWPWCGMKKFWQDVRIYLSTKHTYQCFAEIQRQFDLLQLFATTSSDLLFFYHQLHQSYRRSEPWNRTPVFPRKYHQDFV